MKIFFMEKDFQGLEETAREVVGSLFKKYMDIASEDTI